MNKKAIKHVIRIYSLFLILCLAACTIKDTLEEPAKAFLAICSSARESIERNTGFDADRYIALDILSNLDKQASKINNEQGGMISSANISDQLKWLIAENFDSFTLTLKSGSRNGNDATLVFTQVRNYQTEDVQIRMIKERNVWKFAGWQIMKEQKLK